ncbi:MAG: hypothetical protein IJ723_02030, partial [Ruminococcus sp.]|nr:hypothetical protein [Ruminococcus sp.]
MNIFELMLRNSAFYNELYDTVTGGYTPVSVTGVSGVHKAHIAGCMSADVPILLLCADEAAAVKAAADINTLAGEQRACVFP